MLITCIVILISSHQSSWDISLQKHRAATATPSKTVNVESDIMPKSSVVEVVLSGHITRLRDKTGNGTNNQKWAGQSSISGLPKTRWLDRTRSTHSNPSLWSTFGTVVFSGPKSLWISCLWALHKSVTVLTSQNKSMHHRMTEWIFSLDKKSIVNLNNFTVPSPSLCSCCWIIAARPRREDSSLNFCLTGSLRSRCLFLITTASPKTRWCIAPTLQ